MAPWSAGTGSSDRIILESIKNVSMKSGDQITKYSEIFKRWISVAPKPLTPRTVLLKKSHETKDLGYKEKF